MQKMIKVLKSTLYMNSKELKIYARETVIRSKKW